MCWRGLSSPDLAEHAYPVTAAACERVADIYTLLGKIT